MRPDAGPGRRNGLSLFPTGIVVFAALGPAGDGRAVIIDPASVPMVERRVRQRRRGRDTTGRFSPVAWLLGR